MTSAPLLVVDRADKRFDSFHLSQASLSLLPGKVTALIGCNGAGKSTLIRSIMGLVRLQGGTVTIAGEPVGPFAPVLSRVGYVPDSPIFYEWMTVQEAINFTAAFYPSWDREAERQMKEHFALDAAKKIRALSMGMRTKLSILLALSFHPTVLILDEATSGLDPIFRRDILHLIREYADNNQSCAVLFSSHIISDIEQIADSILVMKEGILSDLGLVTELTGWSILSKSSTLPEKSSLSHLKWMGGASADEKESCVLTADAEQYLRSLSQDDQTRVRLRTAPLEAVLLELM